MKVNKGQNVVLYSTDFSIMMDKTLHLVIIKINIFFHKKKSHFGMNAGKL